MKQKWDKWAIAAEVKRRGSSLRRLALENGLAESATRNALRVPTCPSAERIISDFLEVPLHILWSERYHSNGIRRINRNRVQQSNRNNLKSECKKREAA
ncbi:MAG: helix-turn-helix domain-containing protein [Alphaproteobacteria bacterium]|nr:helix-turn-helix domain-containing protein [Alphaproteobacteria bacterium]